MFRICTRVDCVCVQQVRGVAQTAAAPATNSEDSYTKKEYQRWYYAQNKEKKREYNQKYRDLNKEKITQLKKAHYSRTFELRQRYLKSYFEKHRDKLVEYKKQYTTENTEKVRRYKQEHYQRVKHTKRAEYLRSRREELQRSLEVNAKQFREEVEAFLEIKEPSDWYSVVSKKQLQPLKSMRPFLARFQLSDILQTLYPEVEWRPERFQFSPPSVWNNQNHVRNFLETLESTLGFTSREDWYRVSIPQLKIVGGDKLRKHFGRLYSALSFAFPEYPWDPVKFSRFAKKSSQWWLLMRLKELHSNAEEIVEEYLHPGLIWENKKMQIDLWVPKQSLAIEYQGQQHYHDLEFAFRSSSSILTDYKTRDEEKRRRCESQDIKLVIIPYWWDNSTASLKSILEEHNVVE